MAGCLFSVDNRSNEPGLTQSLSRSLAWNIVYFVSSKRQMTLDNCFTWPAYQGRVLHLPWMVNLLHRVVRSQVMRAHKCVLPFGVIN